MKVKPPGPGTKAPDDTERTEFRQAIGNTKPMSRDYVEPVRRKPAPTARFRQADEAQVLTESLQADRQSIENHSSERLSFRCDLVTERTLRRLGRGHYAVEAEIDLHGMTATEAREALTAFIDYCQERRLGCVRVIHGKGHGSGPRGPVLKSRVNAWLRRWECVLAFVSARIVDGGTGALYVLLKQP